MPEKDYKKILRRLSMENLRTMLNMIEKNKVPLSVKLQYSSLVLDAGEVSLSVSDLVELKAIEDAIHEVLLYEKI